MNEAEEELILKLDSVNNGYNTVTKGPRHLMSEEVKKKISDSVKKAYLEKPHSERLTEQGRKALSDSCKNRVVTAETRQKLSQSAKNRMASEETRKKISEGVRKAFERGSYKDSRVGRKSGFTRTEEEKKEISERVKKLHTEGVYKDNGKKSGKKLKEYYSNPENRRKISEKVKETIKKKKEQNCIIK